MKLLMFFDVVFYLIGEDMADLDRKEQIQLEEYKSLRDETLKRIEAGQNILNLGFIAIGGLIAIGSTSQILSYALTVFPLLSLCFVLASSANGLVLTDIGHYIREEIETKIFDLKWATYFEIRHIHSRKNQNLFAYILFGGMSILALIVSATIYIIDFTKQVPSLLEQYVWGTLFSLGCIAIFIIFWVLRRSNTYHPPYIKEDLKVVELKKLLIFSDNPELAAKVMYLAKIQSEYRILRDSKKLTGAAKTIGEFKRTYEKLSKELPDEAEENCLFAEIFNGIAGEINKNLNEPDQIKVKELN